VGKLNLSVKRTTDQSVFFRREVQTPGASNIKQLVAQKEEMLPGGIRTNPLQRTKNERPQDGQGAQAF
jgi:hypothetical protein